MMKILEQYRRGILYGEHEKRRKVQSPLAGRLATLEGKCVVKIREYDERFVYVHVANEDSTGKDYPIPYNAFVSNAVYLKED